MPEPMSEERLQEIEVRCDKATPNWEHKSQINTADACTEHYVLAQSVPMFGREVDCDFAAHSRTDIPDLILEIRRLKEENAGLRTQLEEARNDSERLDWLRNHVVNVRVPLVYGSRDMFWYRPPFDEEGQPDGAMPLEQMIDAARSREADRG